jgi:sirohydrochlorin cobaltochelatase
MRRALVLFAHGARSASWAAPFERLRDLTRQRLPDVDVSLAFLELMEPRLPAQVDALAAAGEDPGVLRALTDYCVASLADAPRSA